MTPELCKIILGRLASNYTQFFLSKKGRQNLHFSTALTLQGSWSAEISSVNSRRSILKSSSRTAFCEQSASF